MRLFLLKYVTPTVWSCKTDLRMYEFDKWSLSKLKKQRDDRRYGRRRYEMMWILRALIKTYCLIGMTGD